MKYIKLYFLFLLLTSLAFAQGVYDSGFPPIKWTSKNSRDTVTINNSHGLALMVHIVVDKIGSNSAGITIRNCGNTTRLAPGSSIICMTGDADYPISFASDSGINMATGTYQVKQP